MNLKITVLLILGCMLILVCGCVEDEVSEDTEVGEGTLLLQITDKPAELDIINANVTISMIQVHKSNASVEDEEEEEFENEDEFDDGFIADANGPYAGEIKEDIQFLGDATGGEGSYNWSWDFGDGKFSWDEDPIHNYSSEGVYIVNLTVTNQSGAGVKDWYLTTAKIGDDDEESEAGWYTIVEEEQEFDLIAIQDVKEELGLENLTIGKYTQIRLTIENATIRINDSGVFNEYTLKIPSNKVKLIKPFWIYEGETTVLTLDFDAHESVHKTGKDNYMMKPTIKVIQE